MFLKRRSSFKSFKNLLLKSCSFILQTRSTIHCQRIKGPWSWSCFFFNMPHSFQLAANLDLNFLSACKEWGEISMWGTLATRPQNARRPLKAKPQKTRCAAKGPPRLPPLEPCASCKERLPWPRSYKLSLKLRRRCQNPFASVTWFLATHSINNLIHSKSLHPIRIIAYYTT